MISPILSGLRGAAGIRAEGKQMLLHVKASEVSLMVLNEVVQAEAKVNK